MTVYEPPASATPSTITVERLLNDPHMDLNWRLLAGEGGLARRIEHRRIQKSGLVLAGHVHGVVPSRIQILGETELSYLEALGAAQRAEAAGHMFALQLCCVFVTRGAEAPPELTAAAERTDTPLILTEERSSRTITHLHTILDERLAPRARVHGVLVDVFEVGVLLLGQRRHR